MGELNNTLYQWYVNMIKDKAEKAEEMVYVLRVIVTRVENEEFGPTQEELEYMDAGIKALEELSYKIANHIGRFGGTRSHGTRTEQ